MLHNPLKEHKQEWKSFLYIQRNWQKKASIYQKNFKQDLKQKTSSLLHLSDMKALYLHCFCTSLFLHFFFTTIFVIIIIIISMVTHTKLKERRIWGWRIYFFTINTAIIIISNISLLQHILLHSLLLFIWFTFFSW